MASVTEIRVEKYRDGGVEKGRSGIQFRGKLDFYLGIEDYGPGDFRARSYPEVRDNAIAIHRGIMDVSGIQPRVKAVPLVQRDRTLIQELREIGKIA